MVIIILVIQGLYTGMIRFLHILHYLAHLHLILLLRPLRMIHGKENKSKHRNNYWYRFLFEIPCKIALAKSKPSGKLCQTLAAFSMQPIFKAGQTCLLISDWRALFLTGAMVSSKLILSARRKVLVDPETHEEKIFTNKKKKRAA